MSIEMIQQSWSAVYNDRLQRANQAQDPALRAHFQAEVDVIQKTLQALQAGSNAAPPPSAGPLGGGAPVGEAAKKVQNELDPGDSNEKPVEGPPAAAPQKTGDDAMPPSELAAGDASENADRDAPKPLNGPSGGDSTMDSLEELLAEAATLDRETEMARSEVSELMKGASPNQEDQKKWLDMATSSAMTQASPLG